MLTLLPDLTFPVSMTSCNALMDNTMQLNILDAGLSEPVQRAMSIYLHAIDIYVKSKGRIDYRGEDGHRRLTDDAMTFCGAGNPTVTRHGDLPAAHLSLDWNDTQVRSIESGLPLLSTDVNVLVGECKDLYGLSPTDEKRLGLYLDFISKKKAPAR